MIIGYIIIAVALVVIFINLTSTETETVSLGAVQAEKKRRKAEIFRPLYPLFEPLIEKLNLRVKLRKKLGLGRWRILPEEFLARKVLLAALFPFLLFFLDISTDPIFLIVSALVGFILPDVILNSKIKKRKAAIVKVLPETVDLLSLCVGAGLDFLSATRWIIEKVKPNAMIDELKEMMDEINLGKSRLEALRDMAKRLNIPEITSFVRVLRQAEKIGSPVEEAFAIISEDNRRTRRNRGEKQALKAPLKMLIPLLLIMLVLLIIVGGPIMIHFLKGGIGGAIGG
ncbi:MAG: type II secretion system F family protein [Candidatus Omnitrophica bacterium]|nr:type II secretion system F family protein [Candidatus Omnitrophota bacterium]MCF7917244.1 type II secretion system F family protein [Candidatus Omnitrophota bacterium]